MMNKITVKEVLEKKNYEGFLIGVPTGMYADRESYGNAPMLAIILDEILPCKIRARPYSHRDKIKEGKSELNVEKFSDNLVDRVINVEFDDENEKLGITAAFVDQAVRNRTKIEAHGIYEAQLFNIDYLKIENFGFEFPGYKFIFESDEEK